jgi:hypothetical protein
MSWFKKSQSNDAGNILLVLLTEAGQGPLKQMEDPESRLNGYPVEALQQGLSFAMAQLQQKQGPNLSDGQQHIVQQVQSMISGQGPQQSPNQQELPPLGNEQQSGGIQPLGDPQTSQM